jgi:predicted Zn-dependent protease
VKSWVFLGIILIFLNACASRRSVSLNASAKFSSHDYRMAAQYYEELMAKNPQNVEVYNLSMAYLAAGEPHRARPFLYYLHKQDKNNTKVMEALMYAEFTLGEWEQAQLMSEQLLAIDPFSVSAWYYQAQLLALQSQHEVAIELLLKVYYQRSIPQVALALAQNYQALGNTIDAEVWAKLGKLK